VPPVAYVTQLALAAASNRTDCPNGECGYDAGYSTAETFALVAFAIVLLAVVLAIVWVVRRWRRGRPR
jgi:uncharacterized membrane protein YedE/YeeE